MRQKRCKNYFLCSLVPEEEEEEDDEETKLLLLKIIYEVYEIVILLSILASQNKF